MNVDPNILLELAVALLVWGILRLVELGGKWLANKDKTRIIATDGDSKSAHIGLYQRSGNKLRVKADRKRGIQKKTFILEGEGKVDSNFPTWFIHARHGWNLMPEPSTEDPTKPPASVPAGKCWTCAITFPTEGEMLKHKTMMHGHKVTKVRWAWVKKWFKLRVPTDEEVIGNDLDFLKLIAHNPTTYAFAEDTNQTQDMLLATDDKKSMWEVLAPFILIALLVVAGLVIYLVVKVGSLAGTKTQQPGQTG